MRNREYLCFNGLHEALLKRKTDIAFQVRVPNFIMTTNKNNMPREKPLKFETGQHYV